MVMARRFTFKLEFAPETVDHMEGIDRRLHRDIKKAIDEQLLYTPNQRTRNRKPLQRPFLAGATWELRCGKDNQLRIFYEVDPSEQVVRILAIGVKEGNRLIIGGEEVKP